MRRGGGGIWHLRSRGSARNLILRRRELASEFEFQVCLEYDSNLELRGKDKMHLRWVHCMANTFSNMWGRSEVKMIACEEKDDANIHSLSPEMHPRVHLSSTPSCADTRNDDRQRLAGRAAGGDRGRVASSHTATNSNPPTPPTPSGGGKGGAPSSQLGGSSELPTAPNQGSLMAISNRNPQETAPEGDPLPKRLRICRAPDWGASVPLAVRVRALLRAASSA
jgi:hypothetical protein